MSQIDLTEAKDKLEELLETARNGEEVIITKNNRPVAKLVAMPPESKPRRQAGSAKGLIWMSDDFDEPLEEFKDYM